jgi:biopolymer transport protein ExbD
MNFRRALVKKTPTVMDITPLVDVVFQLLIFFLLTSTYAQQQATADQQTASIPVELPESSLTASQKAPEELVISLDSSGLVYLADQQVSLEELSIQLASIAQQNPNTIVLLRGDQNVPYGKIGQVMSIIRASGLKMSAVLNSQ